MVTWEGHQTPQGFLWQGREEFVASYRVSFYPDSKRWAVWKSGWNESRTQEIASGEAGSFEEAVSKIQAHVRDFTGAFTSRDGMQRRTKEFRETVERQRREEVGQRDFPQILAPVGQAHHKLVDERILSSDGSIQHSVGGDPDGSWHRFVYFEGDTPVSGLLLNASRVRSGQQSAIISEVHTLPEYRRHGYAAKLLSTAREYFRSVKHSRDLTSDGKKWKRKVGAFELPPTELRKFFTILKQKIDRWNSVRDRLAGIIPGVERDLVPYDLEHLLKFDPFSNLTYFLDRTESFTVGQLAKYLQEVIQVPEINSYSRRLSEIDFSEIVADAKSGYYDPVNPQYLPTLTAFTRAADELSRATLQLPQKMQNILDNRSDETPPKHDDVETLYHASVNARDLKAGGFASEMPSGGGIGGSQSAKGGEKGVSFTADKYVALQVAKSLREVIGIANGEYDWQDVEDWALADGVDSDTLARHVSMFAPLSKDIPSEHRELGQSPRAKPKKNTPEYAFAVYRAYMSASKRYDPVYFNVSINQFKGLDAADVGVVSAKVDMTDPAIQYLKSMQEFRVPPRAILEVTGFIGERNAATTPAWEELQSLVDQGYFFSMANVPKFGANPTTPNYKNTPYGFYGYPLNSDHYQQLAASNSSHSGLPFAGNREYILVFKPTGNILDVSKNELNPYQLIDQTEEADLFLKVILDEIDYLENRADKIYGNTREERKLTCGFCWEQAHSNISRLIRWATEGRDLNMDQLVHIVSPAEAGFDEDDYRFPSDEEMEKWNEWSKDFFNAVSEWADPEDGQFYDVASVAEYDAEELGDLPTNAQVYKLTAFRSLKNPVKLTKDLMELGFDAVFDPGLGVIHPSERAQVAVMNPSSIQPVTVLPNPMARPIGWDPEIQRNPVKERGDAVQKLQEGKPVDALNLLMSHHWTTDYDKAHYLISQLTPEELETATGHSDPYVSNEAKKRLLPEQNIEAAINVVDEAPESHDDAFWDTKQPGKLQTQDTNFPAGEINDSPHGADPWASQRRREEFPPYAEKRTAATGVYFHGGTAGRTGFFGHQMDRDRSTQDLNAQGPGIYLTKNKDEAARYAGAEGEVYTVEFNGNTFKSNDTVDPEKVKQFINLMDYQAQSTAASNWHEDLETGIAEMTKNILMYNSTMLDALLDIKNQAFPSEPNKFAELMVKIGYDALEHDDHLIVYNPNSLRIESQEKPKRQAALLQAPPAMLAAGKKALRDALEFYIAREGKKKIQKERYYYESSLPALIANAEEDLNYLSKQIQDLKPGRYHSVSFIPIGSIVEDRYPSASVFLDGRGDYWIGDEKTNFTQDELIKDLTTQLSDNIYVAKTLLGYYDSGVLIEREDELASKAVTTFGEFNSSAKERIKYVLPTDLMGWRYASEVDQNLLQASIDFHVAFYAAPKGDDIRGNWSEELNLLRLYIPDVPHMSERALEVTYHKYAATLEHELAHVAQTFLEVGKKLEHPAGRPSGDRGSDDGTREHAERAVEFYPNLISEIRPFQQYYPDPTSNDITQFILESPRFKSVRNRDENLWRKMVTEFTRAVMDPTNKQATPIGHELGDMTESEDADKHTRQQLPIKLDDAARWSDSYSSENQFEDADLKLGSKSAARIQERVFQDRMVTFTALHDDSDEIIGKLQLLINRDQGQAKVWLTYVEPKYQRQGLGHELYKRALQFAKDEDLWVVSDDAVSESARRQWQRMHQDSKVTRRPVRRDNPINLDGDNVWSPEEAPELHYEYRTASRLDVKSELDDEMIAFTLFDDENIKRGEMLIEQDYPGSYQVQWARTFPPNSGWGTQLYDQVFAWARSNQVRLVPDTVQTPEAKHLWETRQAQVQEQPVAAVDLDGTLLQPIDYDAPEELSGQPALSPPMRGAAMAMSTLQELGWKVIIHTARLSKARSQDQLEQMVDEIRHHLQSESIHFDEIADGQKPVADVYIDDHATHFDGDWWTTIKNVTKQAVGMNIDTTGNPNDWTDPVEMMNDLSVDPYGGRDQLGDVDVD